VCQPLEMADIFSSDLFDGITMANNHSYDSGPDAMLDTRALFNARGIQVTGTGRDLAEARKPAIIERNGVKVGYPGYTSVGAPESTAVAPKPGVMNMRENKLRGARPAHARTHSHRAACG
jgi:poly-gamma-glutamate capsule biosynthesis protein CapA/YwtB (metallophosphatase superfamily)